MTVLRQVGSRAVSLVGVLLMLVVAVFVIQRVLPADPARSLVGRTATPEQLAAARASLGLDQSVPVQFVRFVRDALTGDLGMSVRTRNDVLTDVLQYLPATLELVAFASVLMLIGGLVIGVVTARDGALATGSRLVSMAGAAAPTFLLAIVCILVLYRDLGWFPPGGRSSSGAPDGPTGFLLVDTLLAGDLAAWGDAFHHLLLPASVLALGPAVAVGRTLRGALREVMTHDHVRSAHAKGFGELAVIVRHALRNALNPALSMAGLQIGLMLAGSVVVEKVFSWPGVGGYLSLSIAAADFPGIIGVVLVLGIGYVLINFVVDTLQLVVDPRLRSAS